MINIFEEIKNVCKRKLTIPLLVTIIMLVILIICPFTTVFSPTKIDSAFSVTDKHSFVNVTVDTLHYTGYNLTTATDKTYGYYYSLKDNKCVFVIIPLEDSAESVINNYHFLAKVSNYDNSTKDMMKQLAIDLDWNYDDLKSVSADYVLSNAHYYPIAYVVLFWIVLIVLFIAIRNVIIYVGCIINPHYYPVCSFMGKQLQRALIESAQMELDSENYLQINNTYITSNYFIDLDTTKTTIIPLKEIIWCYRLGKLPLNPKKADPDYSLRFTIKSGSEVLVNHKTSDEALETINAIRATGYPIIIGHSEGKRRKVKKIVTKYKKIKETTDAQ